MSKYVTNVPKGNTETNVEPVAARPVFQGNAQKIIAKKLLNVVLVENIWEHFKFNKLIFVEVFGRKKEMVKD